MATNAASETTKPATRPAPADARTAPGAHPLEAAGIAFTRYGLALVLVWIGGMKFTAYEAEGIRPFVENSPLLAWMYPAFGVQGLSNLLGAFGMFLTTLSFLVTTPAAWVVESGGFPVIAVSGQFLLKDAVLLGAALWTAGEAWRAARQDPAHG